MRATQIPGDASLVLPAVPGEEPYTCRRGTHLFPHDYRRISAHLELARRTARKCERMMGNCGVTWIDCVPNAANGNQTPA